MNTCRNCRSTVAIALFVAVGLTARRATAAENNNAFHAATLSITADSLMETDRFLADPKLEGREAGSPGGHAAGEYLADRFAKLHLQPAGDAGGYFQAFEPNYRNILAVIPGSDPALRDKVVVIGAHYDHLGHGLNRRATDPPGPIYPGADDNASGDSAVLQIAQAIEMLPQPPKRTILLALWDGEEKGLLGSKHWTAKPTIPLDRIAAMLNIDMIGNLHDNRLTIFGTRSAYGLRRFVSEQNGETNISLDFAWPMKGDSDHFSFYRHGVPVLFFHTGLHERYHKPTDVAEKINREGMQRVTRLLFAAAVAMADRPDDLRFRASASRENDEGSRRLVQDEPIVARPGDPPLRLGIAWRADEAEPGSIVVSHVEPGSPASAAGLQVGDRIDEVAGKGIVNEAAFGSLVKKLSGPVEFVVEREGQLHTMTVHFAGEKGAIKRAA